MPDPDVMESELNELMLSERVDSDVLLLLKVHGLCQELNEQEQ